MLRKSLALLSYQNSLLRNSILQDVTNQFNILSFSQIQQTHRQQPPPPQQQLQQQPTEQQEVVDQQQQQLEQKQQPNYETLGPEEYVNFTPPHQPEQIQILTTLPPTNLQTAGLYSDIENTDFETFIVNFSNSLQPYDISQ